MRTKARKGRGGRERVDASGLFAGGIEEQATERKSTVEGKHVDAPGLVYMELGRADEDASPSEPFGLEKSGWSQKFKEKSLRRALA